MRIFTKLLTALTLFAGVSSQVSAETTPLPIEDALTKDALLSLGADETVVFRAISVTNSKFLRFGETSVEDVSQANLIKVVKVEGQTDQVKLQITNGTRANKWLVASGESITFADSQDSATAFTVSNPSVDYTQNTGDVTGPHEIRLPGSSAAPSSPTDDNMKQYILRFTTGSNFINCQHGDNGVPALKGGKGSWSFQMVYKYAGKSITVKYQDASGNAIMPAEEIVAKVGSTVSPKSIGYYTCTETSKEVTNETTEIVWTYNVSGLPFELSTATADGNLQTTDAKWYRLYLRDGLVRNLQDEESALPIGAATTDALTDAYWFAFTGTPLALKVWCKDASDALASASAAGDANEGGYVYPTFRTKGDNETNTWKISSSSHVANGFMLTREGSTNETLNKRDQKLAYWTKGADLGSTFWVESLEQIWNSMPDPNGLINRGAVGESIISSDYASIYNAAKTPENLRTLKAKVDAMEKIPFVAGKYYRLQNYYRKRSTKNENQAGNGGYLEAADALALGNWSPAFNSELCAVDPNVESANSLWQISEVEGQTDKYTLKHLNTGKYIGVKDGDTEPNKLVDSGISCTITAVNGYAQHTITPEGKQPLHVSGGTSANGGSITNSAGAENSPSAWYIIPVTELPVTIPAEGYKAVNLPVAIGAIKSIGLKAYIVTGTTDTEATLAVINDEAIVAANTPMILQGTPSQTYNLPISYEGGLSFTTQNKLSGVALSAAITDAAFVLETTDGEAKFAKKTEGNLAQNSAYLTGTDLSDGPLTLNPTGTMVKISEARALPTKAVYYDMQGRRVENPTRGIYVKSTGEKVLILK